MFVISEIEIYPLKPVNGMVAWASFILNQSLYLGSIAVYTRLDGGYRLVFPSKALPNSRQISMFHPISKELGNQFEKAVTEKMESLSRTK